jgi:hypothetical protein
LGADLDAPSSWRAWAEDSLFDFTMANGQHFFPLRALVHELRFGRYTFARFLADVRARERVRAQAAM